MYFIIPARRYTKMMRAQIKMGETIAILVIFFFLVVFGFSFYVSIQESSFEKQKRMNVELSVIEIYQRAKFMTEFQCSFKDIQIDNCYDMYKLRAFELIIDKEEGVKDYYINIFGTSEINIVEIYPGTARYLIYNNSISDFKYREVIPLPISIYNPDSKTFSFGLLNITMYAR